MPSGWYNNGLMKCLDGTIDLDAANQCKLMLIKTTYTFDGTTQDENVISTSLTAAEITGVSGYVGGFNGAGRKAMTMTIQANDTVAPGRVEIAIPDQSWTALGAGDTIGGVALVREVTADSDSIPIAFWDVANTITNGGNIDLDFATLGAGGNLQIACTILA